MRIAGVGVTIPKKLHMMWDSSPDKYPPLVKFCIETWREYNPDYEIFVYEKRKRMKF